MLYNYTIDTIPYEQGIVSMIIQSDLSYVRLYIHKFDVSKLQDNTHSQTACIC